MNAIQLHLAINHVPVVGLLCFGVLYLYGLFTQKIAFQRFSLAAFFVLGFLAWAVYESGGRTEKLVEGLPGIAEGRIEAHEEAAEAAMVSTAALGILGIGMLVAFRRRDAYPKAYTLMVVCLMAASFGLMGWTAHLGGLIHHRELLMAPTAQEYAADTSVEDSEGDH